MKKFKLLFGFLMILIINVSAGEIKYPDSWGNQGFTLIQSRSQGVTVNFSINSFDMGIRQVNGTGMTELGLFGSFVPNDAGAPDIPGISRYIAIPRGAQAVLTIQSMRTEKYEDIDLVPAPVLPLESDDRPMEYVKDPVIYSTNAFYPAEPVRLSQPFKIRGVDVVQLGVSPFQYNPVTKELIIYRDIQLQIDFIGGTGTFGEDRYRSRWWEPILSDNLINYSSLPKLDPDRIYTANRGTGCEYLIITPNGADFVQWANTIKDFRTKQGILTQVVTLADVGGNTVTAIENYVNNAYNTWDIPPAACLLLGDYGTSAENSVIAPIYNAYCVSDNIYADVDNDQMPEIVFARITARNAAELQVMISKFINYEENPPTDPGFYAHPITALGWQTERWFQLCSETIGGFWKNVQGKEPVRINEIYQGTPGAIWSTAPNTNTVVSYFGPSGLSYIPQSPSTLGGWSGGNAAMINAAINNGSFMLQHRDHGMETGWGEPSYTNSNISGLMNTELTFVMSINCLTGKYNWSSECFTEKFHRYTKNGYNSGALGLLAASETSYSFVNDTYVWGVYDNMWPDFMPLQGSTPAPRGILPAFGNAAGKYFLQQSNWPYNTGDKQVTYNLFHHHGDAFLTVYSEVPQYLTVLHDTLIPAHSTTFMVTADDNSFIALSQNGNILGVAEGTGQPVSITIPSMQDGEQFLVTVTKQNYYRYEKIVLVTDDFLISGFDASTTTPCEGTTVDFTDHSIGNPTTWQWTFEGGIPATSSVQNPSGILYAYSGAYDVTLIISDGQNFDTTTVDNLINVFSTVNVGLTIEASTQEICQGEEVTFTAIPVNGGDNPVYEWKVNGNSTGITTGIFTTSSLINGDIISCQVTSSIGCSVNNPASSNDISIAVNEVLPVSVSIEASQNPSCDGQDVTFTAIPVNGGENPVYQWRVNGIFVGDNTSTYTTSVLINNDEVVCVVTSSLECVSGSPSASNSITMAVNPSLVPEISIEPSVINVCEGTEIIFTSTTVNPGDTPVFNWKVNGEETGVNTATYTTTSLHNGDLVECGMISSAPCAINPAVSNTVTMMLDPLPDVPSVAAGPVTVDLNSVTQSDYTAQEVMYSLTYQWEISPESAGIIEGDNITGTVTWNPDFTGPVEITVKGVNPCGISDPSQPYQVQVINTTGITENDGKPVVNIIPNPNNGTFNLEIAAKVGAPVNIRIMNNTGAVVYNKTGVEINGKRTLQLNLNYLEEGIYYLIIDQDKSSSSKKFIIRK
jgi:hypothetical protein